MSCLTSQRKSPALVRVIEKPLPDVLLVNVSYLLLYNLTWSRVLDDDVLLCTSVSPCLQGGRRSIVAVQSIREGGRKDF